MMEIMNGEFSANISAQSFVKEKAHEPSHFMSSLLLHLPGAERQKRIKTYYKFVLLRDPIVRILSAYIDKVSTNIGYGLIQSICAQWICVQFTCTVDLCTAKVCTVNLRTVDRCKVDLCTVNM